MIGGRLGDASLEGMEKLPFHLLTALFVHLDCTRERQNVWLHPSLLRVLTLLGPHISSSRRLRAPPQCVALPDSFLAQPHSLSLISPNDDAVSKSHPKFLNLEHGVMVKWHSEIRDCTL